MKNHETPILAPVTDATILSDEEFDPLSEIRRLRQVVSERIERFRASVVPKVEVSVKTEIDDSSCTPVEKTAPESDPQRLIERVENACRMVATLQETPKEWDEAPFPDKFDHGSKQEETVEAEKTTDSMEELFPLLSAGVAEKEVETKSVDVCPRDIPEPTESSFQENPVVAKFDFTEKIAKYWLSILKGLNSGLAWIGLFGIVCGIVYHLRGETGNARIGLSIMLLGTFLIVIGWSGRFAQEFLNRRAEREGEDLHSGSAQAIAK